jgi:hypothetical protein
MVFADDIIYFEDLQMDYVCITLLLRPEFRLTKKIEMQQTETVSVEVAADFVAKATIAILPRPSYSLLAANNAHASPLNFHTTIM